MVKYKTRVVSKLVFKKTENSKGFIYKIGDARTQLRFRGGDQKFDLLYFVVYYEAKDVLGGFLDFESQAIISIDNNKKKPTIEDAMNMIEDSINKINKSFKENAHLNDFKFTGEVISFNERFAKRDFKIRLEEFLLINYLE